MMKILINRNKNKMDTKINNLFIKKEYLLKKINK